MSDQSDDDQDDQRPFVNGAYFDIPDKEFHAYIEHYRGIRKTLTYRAENGRSRVTIASLWERYLTGRTSISFAMRMAIASAQRETPPSTFLLDLLMKPDEAKDAAANLEDYYPVWVAKHGARRASRIFRFQAGRILVGYWWGRIMTQVERVIKTVSVFVRPGGN